MSQKKLFLFDAYALIYRAHFAFSQNPRMSSKGMNTSAVMGFTNSILEIITKEKPSHMIVAFDTSKPTFRHQYFEEYKATRQETPEDIKTAIPYCKKIVEGFNIPMVEMDGYEADDLIGTMAKQADEKGYDVYMMTPDKDYAQLVNSHVFLYKPARSKQVAEVLGIKEVLSKFDINNVDQVRDMLGLKGDSVDNIPGIPGIGEKTASKLLKEFGSLENIIENVEKLSGAIKKKVQENGKLGLLSKKLATIKTDCPVVFDESISEYKSPSQEILKPLFEELEFKTIYRRVFEEKVASKADVSGQLELFHTETKEDENEKWESIKTTKHNYLLTDNDEKIEKLVAHLQTQPIFCFDTETTSLQTTEAKIVGISFCTQKSEAWYVPCFEAPERIQKFKNILENEHIQKIGQNLKYDIQILKNYNIHLKGKIFDTLLAHFLIDPDSRNNSMDILAERYLNYKTISFEDLVGKKGKNQKTIDQINPELVCDYASEDADITWQLKEIFEKKIQDTKIQKLLHEVEEPLSFVLADMEYEGVNVDTSALKKMSVELEKDSKKSQQEIYNLAGKNFNIGSPKQLGEILFDKLKISENPKKTKTGQYATGEDILHRLSKNHKIAGKILEFREYNKLKSTYVDALPKLISNKDHRIHTDYRQTVASTGRLSSNNPNLQNIPIRTQRGREVRKAFIPKNENYLVLSADYSQIELRIMAAFSKDEAMIQAFKEGKDIHSITASKIFKVAIENVQPEMRRKAKEVNFGIIYGISAFGLSQNLNISRAEAKEVIDSYFKEFPKVKTYMENAIEEAKSKEYVETLLGRKRFLRNINSKNFTMRGFDERNAINAPIQGSAADIIKIAMIDIHKWMKKKNVKSKMIMQVHDELVFDVHKEEIEQMKTQIADMMQNAIKLEVPMEVGLGIGKNWLEAH